MIFIDMDGVLCDITTPVLRLHGREELIERWPVGTYYLHEAMQLTAAETWKPVNEAGTSFWAELPRYEWAEQLVALCESLAGEQCVKIATAPTDSHLSAAGKVIWLQRHFGGRFADPRRYMMGGEKALLAAPFRILVDDNDENVSLFRAKGGQAVLVPQPWNAMHHTKWNDPKAKFRYVREELHRLAG